MSSFQPALREADAQGRHDGAIGRGELLLLLAAFAVAGSLAAVYALYGSVDSDEPQFIHVAWEVAQGQVQYRDFFDNHMPAFGMMMAPVAKVIGENPGIIVLMRFAMMPFVVLCLWLAYRLSRTFFSRRTALWTAAVLAVLPAFFHPSLQFRHEPVWTACWLAALVVLVKGELGWKRALAGGLLIGVAAAVSLKAMLMLGALGIAALSLSTVSSPARAGYTLRRVAGFGAVFVAAVALVPAAFVALFAQRGALGQMYYCVVQHNLVSGLASGRSAVLWLVSPALLLLGAFAARRIDRAGRLRGYDGRLTFVFLTAIAFLSLLLLWPRIRSQTALPGSVVAVVVAAGLLQEWAKRPKLAGAKQAAESYSGLSRAPAWAMFAAFALVAACTVAVNLPQAASVEKWRTMFSDVLRLTSSTDYVLDAKGETIFRQRPYYFCIETMTKARLEDGSVADDIIRRCIDERTCVAAGLTGRFPADVRVFLERNFVKAGSVHVAGQVLPPAKTGQGRAAFDVAVPAEYAVLTDDPAARGLLDGIPYSGPRFLESGPHEWTGGAPGARAAIVWAQAVERGYLSSGVRAAAQPDALTGTST